MGLLENFWVCVTFNAAAIVSNEVDKSVHKAGGGRYVRQMRESKWATQKKTAE